MNTFTTIRAESGFNNYALANDLDTQKLINILMNIPTTISTI